MEASIRSRGFWIHSSHRFSLEPVLDVAAELASEVADDCAAKLVIAPKGPASNQRLNIMQAQREVMAEIIIKREANFVSFSLHRSSLGLLQ